MKLITTFAIDLTSNDFRDGPTYLLKQWPTQEILTGDVWTGPDCRQIRSLDRHSKDKRGYSLSVERETLRRGDK